MKPYLDILKLVWPLALGMINNAAMQFADRAYLAHDSMEALEAVMPSGMLMWIFAGFFQSVVGYSSVLVGQYHGAGAREKCRATYRVAMLLSLAAGLFSVLLVPLGDRILSQTATSARLLADEKAYYTILMLGAVFVYVQMAAASYFTGQGRTRLVFWANLAGNVLNVALDPFLIFGWCGCPGLGIAGAAYATVFAMAVQSAVLVFAAARDRSPSEATSRSSPADVRWFDCSIASSLLRFGLPSGLYTVLNMLSFTVFVFVTGGVGELELAVSNACFSINYLMIAPMEGFSIGASTLVAQAIGRGDPDGAVRDARRTILLGVGFVAVLSAAVLAFSHPILDLFASKAGDSSAAFHSLGMTLLLLMACWQVFDAADVILAGALKGVGDTRFVMRWMLLSAFVLWLPLVFLVRRFHNTMPALWGTMVVYVVVLCIGSWARWRRGGWKEIKVT